MNLIGYQRSELGTGKTQKGGKSVNEESISVEEALGRLEQIVKSLESDAVSLEESLKLFEEGVRLADALKKRLAESELRVKKVLEDSEGFRLEDFQL